MSTMHYITEPFLIDDAKMNLQNVIKEYLVNLIFSEQPSLADKIEINEPDSDIQYLLNICKFLSALQKNEKPSDGLLSWDLDFEGRYHSVVMVVLRAKNNWSQKQE